MTEQEIGELWRKPENYMQPLAFGAALIAAEREACAVLCESHAGMRGTGAWVASPINAPHVKTAAELRMDAAHDTSCVGAFARARPGAQRSS